MWTEAAPRTVDATNNGQQAWPCQNRTRFPAGTRARISRRSRAPLTAGRGDTKCWRLIFQGVGQRFVDPVMGWTGTSDPLSGLELKFPTLESAIRYARRQALDFVVDGLLRPMFAGHQQDAWTVHYRQAA